MNACKISYGQLGFSVIVRPQLRRCTKRRWQSLGRVSSCNEVAKPVSDVKRVIHIENEKGTDGISKEAAIKQGATQKETKRKSEELGRRLLPCAGFWQPYCLAIWRLYFSFSTVISSFCSSLCIAVVVSIECWIGLAQILELLGLI